MAPSAKVVKAAPAKAPTVARVASQAPMRVVAVPKPQKVVRAAPAPARVALAPQATRKQAAPAAQRTAARRPATEREGLSRGSVSLIGVFGGEGGRHALLLMPDGSIERVRPGDRVMRNARVAAIDGESVRLSGSGRDTLLRLPD